MTREFQLHHVHVKEANAIVRSILNVRKTAIDERRQVLILVDAPERIEEAARMLAQVDAAVPEWSVSLVARAGRERTVLRRAAITLGELEAQYGRVESTEGVLSITAAIERAASGEIDLDWSSSLRIGATWAESAHADETLRDGAVVVLVRTDDPDRRSALTQLLGVPGTRAVEELVLEVERQHAERR